MGGTKLPIAMWSLAAVMCGTAFSDDPPKFEVVSIKPTPKERLYHLDRKCSNDRFVAFGMPLSFIIEWSYGLNDSRIFGLPEWVKAWEAAYDFEAKSAAPMSESQCKVMVQSLLADRFRMTVHRETREVPAYLLVLGKRGHKLKEGGDGVTINGARNQFLGESEPAKGWPMSRLASFLSGQPGVNRPVIDKTGAGGTYSFSFTFSLRDGDDRPSIFSAVEDQLGLKLEPAKAPLEVLVVDHIEKASEN